MTLWELSHAQKRIWYAQQKYPGSPLFSIGGMAIAASELETSTLENAIVRLVRTQQALRLAFSRGKRGGFPVRRRYGFSFGFCSVFFSVRRWGGCFARLVPGTGCAPDGDFGNTALFFCDIVFGRPVPRIFCKAAPSDCRRLVYEIADGIYRRRLSPLIERAGWNIAGLYGVFADGEGTGIRRRLEERPGFWTWTCLPKGRLPSFPVRMAPKQRGAPFFCPRRWTKKCGFFLGKPRCL